MKLYKVEGRHSNKIRIGQLIVDVPEVRSSDLQWLLCFMCLKSIHVSNKTNLKGRCSRLLAEKCRADFPVRVSSYHHEMVVVNSLRRAECPFYGIRVWDMLKLDRVTDNVGTLILKGISLDGLLLGSSKNNQALWDAFNQVREIRLINCSFSLPGIEKLLCFFVWTPGLRHLSFSASTDVKEELTKDPLNALLYLVDVSLVVRPTGLTYTKKVPN